MSELRWFKPKTFGWGISPASTPGWIACLVFCLLVTADVRLGRPIYGDAVTGAIVVLLVAGLLVLAQYTGAKDWWRTLGRGD